MIKRNNELKYVKRNYIFPFKPLLDWEYKKFGYRKCDVGKVNSRIFKTVYYVKHKETPTVPLLSIVYGLNFIFSFYRTIIVPILAVITLLLMLCEPIFVHIEVIDLFMTRSLLLVLATPLVALINYALSKWGEHIYREEGVLEKTNRALSNNGWDTWSSYKDNDSRFSPPIPKSAKYYNNSNTNKTNNKANNGYNNSNNSHNQSNTVQSNNNNKKISPYDFKSSINYSTDKENDDEIFTLKTVNGDFVKFEYIASIVNKGRFYVLLVPLKRLEGMSDDQCLIFNCIENSNGVDEFIHEINDDIIEQVMESYSKLFDESNS